MDKSVKILFCEQGSLPAVKLVDLEYVIDSIERGIVSECKRRDDIAVVYLRRKSFFFIGICLCGFCALNDEQIDFIRDTFRIACADNLDSYGA